MTKDRRGGEGGKGGKGGKGGADEGELVVVVVVVVGRGKKTMNVGGCSFILHAMKSVVDPVEFVCSSWD